MKVQVIQEINSVKGIIPIGPIINVDVTLLAKLAGKVTPVTDGRDLPHYCKPAYCWCSSKLTGDCANWKCEYRRETQP